MRSKAVYQLMFFHTKGCEACASLTAAVVNLSRAHNIELVMVHAPDRANGPLISKYGITEIPTVLLLERSKIAVESRGAKLATRAILTHLEKYPKGYAHPRR